jgi:hypothetical protein
VKISLSNKNPVIYWNSFNGALLSEKTGVINEDGHFTCHIECGCESSTKYKVFTPNGDLTIPFFYYGHQNTCSNLIERGKDLIGTDGGVVVRYQTHNDSLFISIAAEVPNDPIWHYIRSSYRVNNNPLPHLRNVQPSKWEFVEVERNLKTHKIQVLCDGKLYYEGTHEIERGN